MPDFLIEKFKELKEISELDLPVGFHDKVLDRVISDRFKSAFITVLSLLLINFAVISIFLITRMINNDAFTFINFMIREFELSENYFNQLVMVLYQNIPLGLFSAALLNIIAIVYIWKFKFLFKNVGRAFLKQSN